MNIKITPTPLSGTVRAISSKSHAHRLLIATAISEFQLLKNKANMFSEAESHCSHEHHVHEHNCTCSHLHEHCTHEQHSHNHHHAHADGHCCSTSPLEDSLMQMHEFQQSVLNKVQINDWNEDLEATKNCIFQLQKDNPVFDCNESGSTLRFMLPVAMALKTHALFCGAGRLPDRPISPLKEQMENHGCYIILPQSYFQGGNNHKSTENSAETSTSSNKISRLIAIVDGGLKSGHYKLPGNVSSQYITGLLFALPLLEGDSTLEITSPLESAGYVDLTLDVLKQFGVEISVSQSPSPISNTYNLENNRPIYHIRGNQQFIFPESDANKASCLCCHDTLDGPTHVHAEGDWSNAAFWIVADLLSNIKAAKSKTDDLTPSVICKDLDLNSSQGDKQIVDFVDIIRKNITTSTTLTFDVAQVPDLVPILAVLACARQTGTTNIVNAGRLRIKESDRLATVREMLENLGATIFEGEDCLSIKGTGNLIGGVVNGHNDHRIVMASAIASILCSDPVSIIGAEAVNKSYPVFWDDFSKLGGKYHEI